ncbi:hypothetical protein Scep_002247 [Stephania cephalantha]|uniref:Uncharacterized protein n=1 Tax=Stephania cephalantha TaxID=152367 RepID=A0AAP0L9X0_9MAGN
MFTILPPISLQLCFSPSFFVPFDASVVLSWPLNMVVKKKSINTLIRKHMEVRDSRGTRERDFTIIFKLVGFRTRG